MRKKKILNGKFKFPKSFLTDRLSQMSRDHAFI
jgi:hypothetical protein